VKDPRGEALQLESKTPADLTRFLEDKLPFVQDRALELLVADDAAIGPVGICLVERQGKAGGAFTSSSDRLEQVRIGVAPNTRTRGAERQVKEKMPMLTNSIRRWVIERHVNRTLKAYLGAVQSR
jgi:hypothetical protein